MGYDWDGRRNRLLRVARITTGAALTLAIVGLPILVFFDIALPLHAVIREAKVPGRFRSGGDGVDFHFSDTGKPLSRDDLAHLVLL